MMQIDLQCSYLIGASMAFMAGRRLKRRERLANARTLVLIVGGMVFAPVWLFITLRWPEWETMYLWDRGTLPLWLVALFLPAISVVASAGFWVTSRLLADGRKRTAYAITGVLAASCAVPMVLGWERVKTVGTLAEYEAGLRGNLLESDLMAMFIVATVWVFTPVAVIVRKWLKEPQ